MNDPFVSCPYDVSHRVPRSRLQGHIVKCPSKDPKMLPCPYNATHLLPQELIKKHVLTCPSRAEVFPAKVTWSLSNPEPDKIQSEYLPETDPNHEIWDN